MTRVSVGCSRWTAGQSIREGAIPMAMFPCDQHRLRYRGPQNTIYPAIVNGSSTMREKRRLCQACFEEAATWIATHLLPSEDLADHVECVVCGDTDTPYAIFATVYAHGLERTDWYGRACRAHAVNDAAMALFGSQASF